jgi:hypothetical protein
VRSDRFGPPLSALGATALFISLFLNWYTPGLSAWDAFEVLDLVMAALALAALWVAAEVLARGERSREGWLPLLGGGSLALVVSQLVNHPPAAQGGSVKVGAWVALGGTAAMALGGALSVAGVSVAAQAEPGERARPERPRRRPAAPADEAAAVEPEVHEELYPEHERRGPIGTDDPELWTDRPPDEEP